MSEDAGRHARVLANRFVPVKGCPANASHDEWDDDSPGGPCIDCTAEDEAEKDGCNRGDEKDIPNPVDFCHRLLRANLLVLDSEEDDQNWKHGSADG